MSRILDYSLRSIDIIPRTDEYLEINNVIVSRIIASVPPPVSLPTAGTLGRHGPGAGPRQEGQTEDGRTLLAFRLGSSTKSSIPENSSRYFNTVTTPDFLGTNQKREERHILGLKIWEGEKFGKGKYGFCFRLRPMLWLELAAAPRDYFPATGYNRNPNEGERSPLFD